MNEAYEHKNSKGKTYYLNTKEVPFGGKPRSIYYFSGKINPVTACKELPEGKVVVENEKNGFLMLKNKEAK